MGCPLADSITKEAMIMNTDATATAETQDREFTALTTVHDAVKGLNRDAQERVLDYVIRKLGLSQRMTSRTDDVPPPGADFSSGTRLSVEQDEPEEDGLDGISPVAQKWMRRNALNVSRLSKLFSLGVDEIDLVAKTVPGTSKKSRTRNVALLKAVAAYLSSGVARVTHEQLKEVCLHYDAYDSPNHAKYLRDMAAELSGGKESGYTLTPRGLSSATDLVKEMVTEYSK